MTLTATAPTSRPVPSLASVALVVGAALSLVLHVLWRVGHGPTVVNEHGVVLGLTNDQWSHLGAVWALPVAYGVVAASSLHRGRAAAAAGALTVSGLALGVVAAWVWPLYSLGALVQYAGTACLAVVVGRGALLPHWATVALWGAVAGFVVAPVWSTLVGPSLGPVAGPLQTVDLVAATAAGGWAALGVALART